jgi:RsmE family RNA methyltransferase
MNMLLLFEPDFVAPGRVRLAGRRLEYVRSVHHVGPGDTLRVGALNGRMGSGTVTAISDTAMEMQASLADDPPAPLPLTLLLAMPRPKVLRRLVQGITAMGIKRVYIMRTWRVEKSYWQTPMLEEKKLLDEMYLGLEQARDTVLPRIEVRRQFKPFVEDEVPVIAGDTLRLVAHPGAGQACPRGVGQPVTLAIGPEGGFIPYEIEALRKAGFTPVSMGERTLRVEQAVPALVGRIV